MKNKIIFKTLMLKGEAGSTIVSMEKTGHVGTADIYTITFNDGSTTEISLENMSAITSVEMTSSTDTEDIYTITCADGSTQTFSVLNHNADIAALSASVSTIDARVDNLVTDVAGAETTTLWSGSMSADGGTYTLSESVSNFDFIDIYYDNQYTGVTDYLRIPASKTSAAVYIPMFETGSSNIPLEIGKVSLTFSGTSVTVSAAKQYFWDGTSASNATVLNAQNSFPVRIDGVKTSASVNAELADVRVGADGTTYNSAGAAVRGQISDLKEDLNSDIGLVTPDSVETGYYISNTGVKNQDSNFKIEKYVIDPTLDYYIAGGASGYITIVSEWDVTFSTLDKLLVKSGNASDLTSVKLYYESIDPVGISICSRTNEKVVIYSNANAESIRTQIVHEKQDRIVTENKITSDDGLGLFIKEIFSTEVENGYYYNTSLVKSAINGWCIYNFTLGKGIYKYEIHSLANTSVGAVVLDNNGTLSLVTAGVSNNVLVKENTGYIIADDDVTCYVTQRTEEVTPSITKVKFGINSFEPIYEPDSIMTGTYISSAGKISTENSWVTRVYNIESGKVYRAIANVIGGSVASIISVANANLSKIVPLKKGNSLTTYTVHDEYIVADEQHTKLLLSFPNNSNTNFSIVLSGFDVFYEGGTKEDKYVSITNNTDNTQQTKEDLSDLSGKTWNVVGDSITAQGLYITPVVNELSVVASNCGVASSTIAVNDTYLTAKSIVERVCGLNGNDPYPDADIWTVMGGLNDKLYNSPLGDIYSTDTSTVYGALKAICDNIRKRENNPLLILVTPTQSSRNSDYMYKLRQAVIDVGVLYACPVIDAYAEAGVNPANLYNLTSDGVHLNSAGTMFLYPLFVAAFKQYS